MFMAHSIGKVLMKYFAELGFQIMKDNETGNGKWNKKNFKGKTKV